jgi:hypothetical protein
MQTPATGQEQAPGGPPVPFDATGEGTSQASDAAVVAFLSEPVKEITPALDQVHDMQFITLLHTKESQSAKPRQAVLDALNVRYDQLMGSVR